MLKAEKEEKMKYKLCPKPQLGKVRDKRTAIKTRSVGVKAC